MAFVYAYIQCLDGPVNWFSLTFCILIQVFLLLTVTLRGVSNKHCLLPLFHFSLKFWLQMQKIYLNKHFSSGDIQEIAYEGPYASSFQH